MTGIPRTCPECGTIVLNLGAHQSKKFCQAKKAERGMRERGFVRLSEAVPRRSNRSRYVVPWAVAHLVVTERSKYAFGLREEKWLPKWAGAFILDNHYSYENIKKAEDTPELQIALAVEYDLRKTR